jgi:hypothetical protein
VEEHSRRWAVWDPGERGGGGDRPHHQAARAGVGPPRDPLRPGGSLILLDASFLGAKSH